MDNANSNSFAEYYKWHYSPLSTGIGQFSKKSTTVRKTLKLHIQNQGKRYTGTQIICVKYKYSVSFLIFLK